MPYKDDEKNAPVNPDTDDLIRYGQHYVKKILDKTPAQVDANGNGTGFQFDHHISKQGVFKIEFTVDDDGKAKAFVRNDNDKRRDLTANVKDIIKTSTIPESGIVGRPLDGLNTMTDDLMKYIATGNKHTKSNRLEDFLTKEFKNLQKKQKLSGSINPERLRDDKNRSGGNFVS